MSATMIRLERVSKSFGTVRAVQDVTLEIGRGEFVALLGPSGCGKTTLLRLIAGFETPTRAPSGWARRSSPEAPGSAGAAARGHGLPGLRALPASDGRRERRLRAPRAGRGVRVAEALALVGLAEHGDRYPHQLSGGQQQRVALARALAPEPAVVLLDEPWSNIDPVLRTSMRDELAGILRATGVTVLLVTHEQEEAFSLADRVAVMRDGAIVQAGVPEEIYYAPATRGAAEFVGAANVLPGGSRTGWSETLVGRFPAPNGDGPGDVEVLVRPELLALNPIRREREGRRPRVPRPRHLLPCAAGRRDDRLLAAASNESIPLGARVALRPHVGRVALFPLAPEPPFSSSRRRSWSSRSSVFRSSTSSSGSWKAAPTRLGRAHAALRAGREHGAAGRSRHRSGAGARCRWRGSSREPTCPLAGSGRSQPPPARHPQLRGRARAARRVRPARLPAAGAGGPVRHRARSPGLRAPRRRAR